MQTQHLTTFPEFKRFSGTMGAVYSSLFNTDFNTEMFIKEETTLIEINNDVLFIGDYLKKEKEKTAVVRELEEILENLTEWEEDGIKINISSVEHAIHFVHTSIIANNLPNPDIEIHPDGETAFTWRKIAQGIMNIAFNKEGIATWAAYIDGENKRTLKGRFKVENPIPEIEKTIIQAITN